jgi:hypothetical protein
MSGALRVHVPVDENAVLCGSRALTSLVGAANCSRCCRRLDDLIGLLLDAAAGKNVQEDAAKLAAKLGIEQTNSEEPVC